MKLALQRAFSLRARKGMDAQGRLLLEGLRLTSRASTAGVRFEHVFYAPEFYCDDRCEKLVSHLLDQGVSQDRLEPRAFSKLSRKAEGIVGVVQLDAGRGLLGPSSVHSSPLGTVLVLDSLSDPGNIGACLRTANAWGAERVLVVDDGRKLYHPKSLRASMGALFDTPTCAVTPRSAVTACAKLARPIVTLCPDGNVHLADAPLDGAIVVVGNEKRGIHPRWNELECTRAAIPMVGAVDSLNAATSAAIALWEAFRRVTA